MRFNEDSYIDRARLFLLHLRQCNSLAEVRVFIKAFRATTNCAPFVGRVNAATLAVVRMTDPDYAKVK